MSKDIIVKLPILRHIVIKAWALKRKLRKDSPTKIGSMK